MKPRRLRPVLTLLILALALTVLIQVPAYGNISELRQRMEETRREIAELESILKALDDSINARLERIGQLEAEFQQTENTLLLIETELAEAEIRLEQTSRNFASRVRGAYMKGSVSYLEVLLEAESLGDLVVRVAYVARILANDSSLIARIRDDRVKYGLAKAEMEQKRETLQTIRVNSEKEQRNLLLERQEKERLLRAAKNKLAGELARITPQAERPPVYAVVLDNVPLARPQHGLARASMVYEYEVEGRITRYLAFFANFPTKVGPVRSARTHSSMLALENNVNFIYSSAGVDVLAQISSWKAEGTNVLYYSSRSVYRDPSRRAPHNLYVNLSTLGVRQQSKEVVVRPAFLNRKGTSAGTIALEYSPSYRLRYEYNSARGIYRRFINNAVHRDATGEEIQIRNIIIQYAPHYIDQQGRPTPNLIGEGKIDYYTQGERFTGSWKKESASSLTRFFYEDGEEIERVYGLTWIQIVRQ